jgi:nucleoside-diphosphate-sugar epimerase
LVRRRDHALASAGVECVVGELRDQAVLKRATQGVDVVYHAAAVTLGMRGDLWHTNVEGTRALLQACVANDVGRFVFLSTVSVYRPPLAPAIDEDAPTGGLELYGRSKTAAEAIVRQMAGDRIEHVILRPCQIYGSNDRSGYTSRLLRVLAARRVPVARGPARFSLVHVDDVVDAIVAAGAQPAAGGRVYNIAGPGQTSLRELADVVMGRPISIPRPALRVALSARWLLGAARDPNVRPFLRSYAHNTLHGSMWLGGPDYLTTRARRELGYVPQVDPASGLRRLTNQTTTERD